MMKLGIVSLCLRRRHNEDELRGETMNWIHFLCHVYEKFAREKKS